MVKVTAIFAVLVLAAGAVYFTFDRVEPREVTTLSEEAYSFYEQGVEEQQKLFWPEAVVSFQKAVEIDPNFASAHMELALACGRLGEREECIASINNAYELREGCTDFERRLIEFRHAQINDEDEVAKDALAALVEAYPDKPEVVNIQASRAMSDQEWDAAIELFERELTLAPDHYLAHNNLGYLYVNKGQYDDGIANLRRYAYFAPNQPNPHDSLGDAYMAAGLYEDAMAEYLKALEIKPSFYHSALNLARVLMITGQTERALATLEESREMMAKLDKDQRIDWMRLNAFAGAERYDDAMALIEELLDAAVDEENADWYRLEALAYQGYILIETGKIAEAESTLDEFDDSYARLIKEKPNLKSRSLWQPIVSDLIAAKLAWAKGQDVEFFAKRAQRKIDATDYAPHRLVPWRTDVAQVLLDAGKYDLVIEQAEAVLELHPNAPRLNLFCAQAYARLGQNGLALEHLGTFLHVMRFADPDYPKLVEARSLYAELTSG